MGKTLVNTIKGAAFGAIGAGCLFVIGFFVEVLNVGCAILTCDCDKPKVFDWSGMWGLLFICVIGGAVIGMVYGIYKVKEENNAEKARRDAENSEEAQKQRMQWASEVKKKALNISNTCEANGSRNIPPLVSRSYKADTQMELILSEFANATELMGKIDAMAEEVQKGGGSK